MSACQALTPLLCFWRGVYLCRGGPPSWIKFGQAQTFPLRMVTKNMFTSLRQRSNVGNQGLIVNIGKTMPFF